MEATHEADHLGIGCGLDAVRGDRDRGQPTTWLYHRQGQAAHGRYAKGMKDLDDEYQRKAADIRRAYIAELKQAQEVATKAGNLDEAVKIRNKIQELEEVTKEEPPKTPEAQPEPGPAPAEPPTDKRDALKRSPLLQEVLDRAERWRPSMAGLRFTYPGGDIRLNPDGSVTASGSLATEQMQWSAGSQHRALLYYPKQGDAFQVLTLDGDTVQAWTFQKDWSGQKVK